MRWQWLRECVRVAWRQCLLTPRFLWLMGMLLSRERQPQRRARKALWRALGAPPALDEPLRALEPGLFEVAQWYLRGEARSSTPRVTAAHTPVTLVHMLGTGENVYSPLVGLRLLCRADARLCALKHVIVDTPHDAAGYLGPAEFSTRVRRTLAPLLARESERLVIVGLSRGALAGIDLGADLASETHARVAVLALAPPLTRPSKLPDSVRIISGFEPMSENFVRYMQLMPWLAGVGTWIMRVLYVRICAFVLAELHMDSEASLDMFARYIAHSDPKLACLRAVREFALVARVSEAELRHALTGALQRIAFSETAHITVCWGSADTWLDVASCQERLLQKLALAEVPESRVRVHVLAGVGHGVSRDDSPCHAQLAQWLWEAAEHACADGYARHAHPELGFMS